MGVKIIILFWHYIVFSLLVNSKGYISWKKSRWGGWSMSNADNTWKYPFSIVKWRTKLLLLTFSCLKKHNIFNSLKTRFEDTSDWNTFGNFFKATRLPSLGSVTALKQNVKAKNHTIDGKKATRFKSGERTVHPTMFDWWLKQKYKKISLTGCGRVYHDDMCLPWAWQRACSAVVIQKCSPACIDSNLEFN